MEVGEGKEKEAKVISVDVKSAAHLIRAKVHDFMKMPTQADFEKCKHKHEGAAQICYAVQAHEARAFIRN